MSISLNQVEQTQFNMEVKAAYDSKGGLLTNKVYTKTDVIGRYVDFRKAGSITAVPMAFQDSVTPQDPGYSRVTATLTKFAAPAYVDDIQQLTVNFNERSELVMLTAEAVMRRADQLILDALNASATTNTIAVDYGSSSGNTNITFPKLQRVVEIFNEKAVPRENRFIAIGASQDADLLNITQFIDSRFTNIAPNAVSRGAIDGSNNLGLNFVLIPTMTEGGLPLSGTVRTCFAFHSRALGMAVGQNMRTEINYLPKETSWLVNSLYFAGAIAIDNEGIIKISCDEAA